MCNVDTIEVEQPLRGGSYPIGNEPTPVTVKDISDHYGTDDTNIKLSKYKRDRIVLGAMQALKNANIGRNSKCPCESGKKFKQCHLPHLENANVSIFPVLAELHLYHKKDSE